MNTQEIQSFFDREIKPVLAPIQEKSGGLDYYVFQTRYKQNPDLLLVGINPGGDEKVGGPALPIEIVVGIRNGQEIHRKKKRIPSMKLFARYLAINQMTSCLVCWTTPLV
jgi:hypothetical protein